MANRQLLPALGFLDVLFNKLLVLHGFKRQFDVADDPVHYRAQNDIKLIQFLRNLVHVRCVAAGAVNVLDKQHVEFAALSRRQHLKQAGPAHSRGAGPLRVAEPLVFLPLARLAVDRAQPLLAVDGRLLLPVGGEAAVKCYPTTGRGKLGINSDPTC